MPGARWGMFVAAAIALVGGVACSDEHVAALEPIHLDPTRVAVAGLSSGAYMATQVHVALNARIHGAALLAGGPYGCAQGVLDRALGPCMTAEPEQPDVDALAAAVRERAADGRIDALKHFHGDRALVLHGTKDTTVAPELAPLTAALYTALGGDGLGGEGLIVTLDDHRAFGHGWPTESSGAPCTAPASPWLLNCGIDAAGIAMQALFGVTGSDGEMAPANASGRWSRFDQTALTPADVAGLADTGFIYTPTACAESICGALVVFHGCQQNAEHVGEIFVRDAGFNRWADLHRVVVVYPQTQSSYLPLNPKACWDWWGYSGTDYDTRAGGQVRFVAALLDRLAGTH